MNIILNGKPKEVAATKTVAELLKQLDLELQQVVIERNGAIIARQDYADTRLHEGDQLEIVQFVGGG